MSEINNKCPLCGKQAQAGESFCIDCQEIADKSYPSELLTSNPKVVKEVEVKLTDEPEEKQLDEPVDRESPENQGFYKSNKKTLIFLGIGLFLMLLIGGVSSYLFIKNKEANETETAYWERCLEQNTPLSYSKYLVQYPEGKYSLDAQNKIVELRQEERKEWEQLRDSADVNQLFAFLTDHPNTPYARQAKHLADSLSWLSATTENTADAYKAYIENVNLGNLSGEYLTLAQEKYDYMSQLKTLEGEELKEVNEIIVKLLHSLSTVKSKELKELFAPTLTRFYDAQNISADAIVEGIQDNLKKNKIKAMTYTTLSADSLDAILDNKGIYFISLPVKREIVYTDKKKKKDVSTHHIKVELNKERQVQSLFIKD